MGAIGTWRVEKKRGDVLRLISETFASPAVRYNRNGSDPIKSVALVGGAGMEFYEAARFQKADAFITADVRYHDFHRADHDKILLIDAGHAETERFVSQGMARAARKALETNEKAWNAVNLQGLQLEKLLLVAHSEPNAVRYYSRS